MNGLVQVQPIMHAGAIIGLIGLRGDGNVYYGELTGGPPSVFTVKWSLVEEKK